MNNKPLVSTIMIFLNEEWFIEEAIESVFSQTYDNCELLLVDDGTTDNSTEIARRYAAQFPRKVSYLQHDGHQNRGMSASRNLGIRHAKGKYISFLDADDVWLPHKLEQQVDILESQPEAAMVCGQTKWWYSWTDDPEHVNGDFIQRYDIQMNSLITPPDILLLYLRDEGASPCDALIRRQIVDIVGGYENRFTGMYEDQVFYSKVCLEYPVFVATACWYLYRQHRQACCWVSDSTGQSSSARLAFLSWLKEYLFDRGIDNKEVRQAVERELWPYRHPYLGSLSKLYQNIVRPTHWRGIAIATAKRMLPDATRLWLRSKWQSPS